MKRILVTCGETSGEHNAARLVSGIKELDPSCRVLAMGGAELAEAGAEVLFPMSSYAVMGFSEVFTKLPRFLSLERKLKKLLSGGIDLFIPVDYPGLNLRLAARARRAGIPVMYFISPQVWAWGGWRIGRMRRTVDLMVSILPFEVELYRAAGIPVTFAGHPLHGEIAAPQAPKEVPGEGERFVVACFPGSRRQEVERIFPPMLDAMKLIKKRLPGAVFRVGVAPLIGAERIVVPEEMRAYVDKTAGNIQELLAEASLVLAVSGTVTLQTALSGTPVVVMYRTSALTYLLGRLLVRIDSIAMPNLLAGRRIVPELIQGDATAERIAAEAVGILSDARRYREISSGLLELGRRLEGDGGIHRIAQIALRMADGDSAREILAAGK